MTQGDAFTAELAALATVLTALEPLDDDRRRYVLRMAAERLGVPGVAQSAAQNAGQPEADSDGQQRDVAHGTTIDVSAEDFIDAKRADVDVQRAAVLAYYLKHFRNQRRFKSKDLAALNTEAAGHRFGNMNKTVNNASARDGFFVAAGEGFKQLTRYGEQIVEALPDAKQVKEIIQHHRPRAVARKRKK